MKAHDGGIRNKPSFFNRVYDCGEKSDCQSYSDTTVRAIPLSTIYIQDGCESYTPVPSLGGDISGAKFRQVCFD